MYVSIAVAVVIGIAAVIFWMAKRKKSGDGKPQVDDGQTAPASQPATEPTEAQITIKPGVWYMCVKDYSPYEAGQLYIGADIDPTTRQWYKWYKYFREATEEEIAAMQPEPEPTDDSSSDEPEDTEADMMMWLTEELVVVLEKFGEVVEVHTDSLTYKHLLSMAWEAYNQYYNNKSVNELPMLVNEDLFPVVYDYFGDRRDEYAAFLTMMGWMIGLQLSELAPQHRNSLLKIGYEVGGHTMQCPFFEWEFRSDPNVMRIIAGALYNALRSRQQPDFDAMRQEVGGKKYGQTLAEIYDAEPRKHVTDDAFYIDLRRFMASAPGPYAPGYQDRSGLNQTIPDEKTDNGCLKMDMHIHQLITEAYNLPDQTAVQAIADKDAENSHLFGEDRQDIHGYDFTAVFGWQTIGMRLPTEGKLPALVSLMLKIGSSARGILQHADKSLGAMEYGRLRPGCSWEKETTKHSTKDDRLNVLTCFDIEDNDGNPTGYYDRQGNWVYPSQVKSAKDYEELQKRTLYANSYPSGHSSGIMSAALTLIELFPNKADVILRAANHFAMNRTVARYHWTSDTIQGRVLGTAINAVCHAAKDYFELVKEIEN